METTILETRRVPSVAQEFVYRSHGKSFTFLYIGFVRGTRLFKCENNFDFVVSPFFLSAR
jgi:hypothetical protein